MREPRLAWELEEPALAGGCHRLIYQQHKLSVGTTNRGQGEKQAFVNRGETERGERGYPVPERLQKLQRHSNSVVREHVVPLPTITRFFPLDLHDCKENPEGFAWGSHQVKGEQPWAQVTAA